MRWIVCCIDGTNSAKWRNAEKDNSHVCRFWRNFGKKIDHADYEVAYFDGPNSAITGFDAKDIKIKVIEYIGRSIKGLLGQEIHKSRDHQYCRVVIVGHSRGGAIAIDLAKYLQYCGIEVYFMGLFDAVDRSTAIDGGPVSNTKYAYHALRGLDDSRWYFGNAGTTGCITKKFNTSHGGIGGDVVYEPSEASKGDCSCSLEPQSLGVYVSPSLQAHQVLEPPTRALSRVGKCIEESHAAYAWILGHAREHDLPI